MAIAFINEKRASNNFVADGTLADGSALYRVPNPQDAVAVTYTKLEADGGYITANKDNKSIILLNNPSTTAKATVTIKGGNSYAGIGSAGDLGIELDAGQTKFVSLDSAKFADKYTGRITIEGTDINVAVLEVR